MYSIIQEADGEDTDINNHTRRKLYKKAIKKAKIIIIIDFFVTECCLK